MAMHSTSNVVNMEFRAVFESQLSLPSPNNLFPVNKLSCFRLTSLPTKAPKFVRLKASLTCDDQEINRKFKKMQPSPWTDLFHSVSTDVSEINALKKEIDILKPKVKNILMLDQEGIHSTKKRILMIYLLKSLGLAYHFEEEIYEILKEDFGKIKEMMAAENDLYTVSTIFWVFRSYCHYISSDVFTRFKGIDGNFKEFLKGNVKGILSLYEAAHLQTSTDYILEEALSFASTHLESLASCVTCPTHLSMRIQNVLIVSQRWNMEIVAIVEYISSYEQENDHDEILLKFAKISFKLVQLQYLQELKILSKWNKELDFASNLPPYFRDRMVENYFYVLAVFFEPQLLRERIMFTKFCISLVILDDTFDRYATPSEAASLSNSLKRWAPDHAMDQQPDYLKFVFNSVLDTFEEFERELRPEGTSYSVKATIEEIKIFSKSTTDIEKWAQVAYVPSFEEYMKIREVDVGVYASMASIFMCLGNKATKEAYEWLNSRPKLVKAIAVKGRLENDITGFKDDISRGNVTNAISCYMKQYGVTEQEAIRELYIMVADADKAINEELLTTTGVSRSVLKAAIGLSQMITLCYNGYEGLTCPEGKTKEYMTMILVDPIRL